MITGAFDREGQSEVQEFWKRRILGKWQIKNTNSCPERVEYRDKYFVEKYV
jgi:hypothetical protein